MMIANCRLTIWLLRFGLKIGNRQLEIGNNDDEETTDG